MAYAPISRAAGAAAGLSEAVVTRLPGLNEPARQRDVTRETEHRPWPLPDDPWFMAQSWRDLLFAHWRVPVDALAQVVPDQLPIDSRDGAAWIGVTPFVVSGLRVRGSVPVPIVSRFPELNVRTYVTVGGEPGIYFLSLDAARRSAVLAARRSYRLPYFHAQMTQGRSSGEIHFSSTRISSDGPRAAFTAGFRPVGPAVPAVPGSLEHFLTERYCLYTLDDRGRILRGEIHHPPWPLQKAIADIPENTMTSPFGIELDGEPTFHFAARQDVVLWRIRPADE
jgi:uncharacterized protein YqjF (DUF2071 family)